MLRLIKNLPAKKGVSVVISTHILGDVEACCDAVLILGRGRLLVYDTIEGLARSIDTSCRVRVEQNADRLRVAIEAAGFGAEKIASDELRVSGTGDLSEAVFSAAKTSGVVVREVRASRNTLEDRFLDAVRATEGAAGAPQVEAG